MPGNPALSKAEYLLVQLPVAGAASENQRHCATDGSQPVPSEVEGRMTRIFKQLLGS
jgi:hypothetical protein